MFVKMEQGHIIFQKVCTNCLMTVVICVCVCSLDEVAHLFSTNGFSVIENSYIERETVNHKEGITVKRIFIQGKFKTTNHKEDK